MSSEFRNQVRISITTANDQTNAAYQSRMADSGEIDFDELCEVITKKCWCPSLFRDGRRRNDNFISSDLVVLDFDDPVWGLDDALGWVTKYGFRFVIGLTRNHQKEKDGKIPCDRFRLVLFAGTRCEDPVVYRRTMEAITRKLPVDKKCKDPARFFYPCSEIWEAKSGGAWMEWVEPEDPRIVAARAEIQKSATKRVLRAGEIPAHIARRLRGASNGTRNSDGFFIARSLAEAGMSAADIETILQRSPIGDLVDNTKDPKEFSRMIANGIRKGKEKTSG